MLTHLLVIVLNFFVNTGDKLSDLTRIILVDGRNERESINSTTAIISVFIFDCNGLRPGVRNADPHQRPREPVALLHKQQIRIS